MNSNYKTIIDEAYNVTKAIPAQGKIATYIPELASIDPNKFGVHMMSTDGTSFGIGDNLEKFSIQSVAKGD